MSVWDDIRSGFASGGDAISAVGIPGVGAALQVAGGENVGDVAKGAVGQFVSEGKAATGLATGDVSGAVNLTVGAGGKVLGSLGGSGGGSSGGPAPQDTSYHGILSNLPAQMAALVAQNAAKVAPPQPVRGAIDVQAALRAHAAQAAASGPAKWSRAALAVFGLGAAAAVGAVAWALHK